MSQTLEQRILESLPVRKMKTCCMCQNEFELIRNQICCSRKCSLERRNLKIRLAYKEKPKSSFVSMTVMCRMKGCKKMIVKGKQQTNLKYCEPCALIQTKNRMAIKNKTYQDTVRAKRGILLCYNCAEELKGHARKFCNLKCRRVVDLKRRAKGRLQERIDKHLNSAYELRKEMKSV